jgi:hypothetical protein
MHADALQVIQYFSGLISPSFPLLFPFWPRSLQGRIRSSCFNISSQCAIFWRFADGVFPIAMAAVSVVSVLHFMPFFSFEGLCFNSPSLTGILRVAEVHVERDELPLLSSVCLPHLIHYPALLLAHET